MRYRQLIHEFNCIPKNSIAALQRPLINNRAEAKPEPEVPPFCFCNIGVHIEPAQCRGATVCETLMSGRGIPKVIIFTIKFSADYAIRVSVYFF
ncbi:MAG: hypothetical protein JWP34_278 [Massilia sp.]|jgi:hypothetical protein|nr:hypothetical protein [Massilia sp.]